MSIIPRNARVRRTGAIAALSITPLIDVVFLLLIFFLVATRFSEDARELEVTLPQASEALPITAQPREFLINIDERGRYFVDGYFRDLGELERLLEQSVADNPLTQTVILRADRRASWDHVAAVFNLCKKLGAQIYAHTEWTEVDLE